MSRAHICSHEVKCPVVWRIVIMMLLVPRGALSRSATLSARSAAGSRVRLTSSSATVRTRTTSVNSMSFGRNSARSRSGPGKPTRRGRGGCGGTPGGGSNRRAGHEIRARGRRSAFGEDRMASNGAGQLPLGFWDAGDVLLVERSGRGSAGAGGRQGGRRRGDVGKQYQSRRGGGTFSAKVSTSANLLGAPPKWNFKKVDLSVLPRGFQAYTSSKANAGQKRRGAAPSAVAVEEFSPPSIGQGRRRGAKRSIVYAGLAAYNAHFASLVVMELKHEKEKAYERMTSWTQRELSCGGYALQGLVGARVGRLYREHVVRFSLPPRRGDNKGKGNPLRRPPMPYHRFTAGDVVAITPGSSPPTLSQMDTGAVLDGVVLQRMPHFIDVVVKICPEGLAGVTPSGRVVVGGSAATFRLDHFVNGVSYDRMLQALQTATAPETLSVCPVVRGLVMDSLFPTLDRIVEIDKAGGVQPGIGNSGLPPGLVAPDAEWSRIALGTRLAQTSSGSSRGNIARVVSGLAVDSGLNKRQAQAVRQALESRLTLIQGPPGTGKTKTACSIVQAAVMLREGKGAHGGSGKVMATAFSNVAADNLLEGVLRLGLRAVRIGRPATVRPALWDATLDAMVEKHPGVVAARRAVKGGSVGDGEPEWTGGGINEVAPSSSLPAKGSSSPAAAAAAATQAFAILEGAQEHAAKEILKEVDVVVCSCIGAGNDAFVRAIGGDQESGSSSVRFSTVLIDEATQATEAAALVPIIRGCQQLILVGDQNQLPPTVISPEAEDGGLGTSLFSRLMHAGIKPILLDRQYRMHPAISDFPSGHFYDGQVVSGIRQSDRPTPRGFPWPTETAPVAFVLVNGKGHGDGQGDGEAGEPRGASWRGQLERRGGVETAVQGGSGGAVLSSSSTLGTSYCNDREAWAVASALELVVGGGDVEVEDVGVITPYAAQVRLLQDVVGASRRSAAKAQAQAGVEAKNTPDPPGAGSNGNNREEGASGGDLYASGGRGTASRAGSKAETVMPEIASVDGYQGREKEVIILSAVRSNRDGRVGFLSDWRRLNVAITRARRGVVVVGDPDTLKRDKHWRAFLRWCEQRGAVMGEAELFAAGEGKGRERLTSFPEEKTA